MSSRRSLTQLCYASCLNIWHCRLEEKKEAPANRLNCGRGGSVASQPTSSFTSSVAELVVGSGASIHCSRHKFDTVDVDSALSTKADKLSNEHFRPLMRKASLEFGKIVSSNPTPSFYSPKAIVNNTPTADLALFKEFQRTKNPDVFEYAGCNAICDARHHIMIQHRSETDKCRWVAIILVAKLISALLLSLLIVICRQARTLSIAVYSLRIAPALRCREVGSAERCVGVFGSQGMMGGTWQSVPNANRTDICAPLLLSSSSK